MSQCYCGIVHMCRSVSDVAEATQAANPIKKVLWSKFVLVKKFRTAKAIPVLALALVEKHSAT